MLFVILEPEVNGGGEKVGAPLPGASASLPGLQHPFWYLIGFLSISASVPGAREDPCCIGEGRDYGEGKIVPLRNKKV